MSLKLIVVGKLKNRNLAELCDEYAKRISRYGGIEITELKDGASPDAEGVKILDAVKNFKGAVYAMGEEGKAVSSKGLSKILEADLLRGGSAFIIGGAYGLSGAVKERADKILSMSEMTFTHEFARAILLEQLYRAKTISAGTGYHH